MVQPYLPTVTILAMLTLWLTVASRRARKKAAERLAAYHRTSPSPALMPRPEFEENADRIRGEMGRGTAIALGTVVLGFPGLFAIQWLVPGFSSTMFFVATYALLGVAIASIFGFAVVADRHIRQLGLLCPGCGVPLIGGSRGQTPIDTVVLTTGQCPRCHTQILEPAEVGYARPKLTVRERVRAIAVIAVLLFGTGAIVYLGNGALTAMSIRRCNSRYALAQSATDSAAVDGRRLTQRGPRTCGDLRREGRLAQGSSSRGVPAR